jgi:uncharacterized protein (TIGR00255 family)
MTGFARASGADARWRWSWETRSVNGRGLELRVRLPNGHDRLEMRVRAAVAGRFQRGNVSVALTLEPTAPDSAVSVNRARLLAYAEIARAIAAESGLAPARIDGLMALRGVLEQGGESDSEADLATRDAAILDTLGAALGQLAAARASEGAALARVVEALLDTIAALTRDAAGLAASQPETIRAKLQEQLAELLGGSTPLAPERLLQEVAVLAQKADVREELDRLVAHVDQARQLLRDKAGAGRKLEFLAQEFNREANTLCSKSADLALTRIGLELKTAIDRLREQAANIE